MRLLVFADLHLDTAFTWAKAEAARKRRQGLRDTLLRILSLADEVGADAIMCAGDLYEQDRFTPDTREFLRTTFAATHRRVLLAPGNHDWYGARSLYTQVIWSENVHVFETSALTPFELTEGFTVWGAAFHGPTRDDGFLSHAFAVDRGGINIGLFHGSERGGLGSEIHGKSPYASFDSGEIKEVGLLHAFVGHYHRPMDAEFHTYPGNPDPLSFGETGERGTVIADVDGGTLKRERRVVAVSQVHDITIDVGGCTSFQDIRDRVEERLKGVQGMARLVLTGEIAPDISLDLTALRDVPHELEGLVISTRDLHEAYNFEAISREPSVRGQFLRDVLECQVFDEQQRRRILVTGIRALDGRDDLEIF